MGILVPLKAAMSPSLAEVDADRWQTQDFRSRYQPQNNHRAKTQWGWKMQTMRMGLWVKSGICVTSSQSTKAKFGHSSVWTEEHSYLLVWLGGVISQQRAAGHYTSTLELDLQWVISSQFRVWGYRRARILTRLRLNAIAGATPGLSSQSPPAFPRTGISYLIGHWWVALFPQTLMTEAESKRNSKHLPPNLRNMNT